MYMVAHGRWQVFCMCKGSQCYNAVKKLDGSSSDESDGEGVR